ncbi:MAG: leucine-rich repeat domain-containing protein [Promethearchaeota archaeon]|jgi:Leucine-rich repeat (LRR) protein
MKEFKINKYITLKLEKGITNIYIKEQLFRQCLSLVFNIPANQTERFEGINSIEEAVEKYNYLIYYEGRQKVIITPETEFWGHCSNLQAWVESGYDTRVIHSNLAFPLLKKLHEVGDPAAKRLFHKEVIKRFQSGYPSVIHFLICEDYFNLLSKEERQQAFKDFNYEYLKNDISMDSLKLLEYIIDLGAPKYAETILKEHVFTLLYNISEDDKVFKFLVNYDLMHLFTKEELDSINIKEVVLEGIFNIRIPFQIGFLTSLEELTIYSEHTIIELPDTIGDLINLKKLDLLNCDVKNIPQAITKLKSLRSLSLPYYISSIPDWIGTLTNLEELKISVHDIKEIPTFIKYLKNLKILKIYSSHNLKSKESLKELTHIEKLELY